MNDVPSPDISVASHGAASEEIDRGKCIGLSYLQHKTKATKSNT